MACTKIFQKLVGVALLTFAGAYWAVVIEVPSHEQMEQELASRLTSSGDYNQRSIKRLGDRTIEMQVYISMEVPIKAAEAILVDIAAYPSWITKNINTTADKKKYLIQIRDLAYLSPSQNGANFRMHLDLLFPIFKKKLVHEFNALTTNEANIATLYIRAIDDKDSLIENCQIILKVFPAKNNPKRTWVWVKAVTQLRSWILYELLPDSVLQRESGYRIQIIASNYMDKAASFSISK